MSKFVCNCDHIIDLVDSPADEEFMLIPEQNVEMATTLCSEGEADEEIIYEVLDKESRQVIICPKCGRIWLNNDVGTEYQSYIKEQSKET